MRGGATIHIQGFPQKGQVDGYKPKKSIKKTAQRTEKGLLGDRQLHTNIQEKAGQIHKEVQHHHTNTYSTVTSGEPRIWSKCGQWS